MKKRPTSTTNEKPSACQDSSVEFTGIGRFPKRVNTVIADVLACLLEGQRSTGMAAVLGMGTTRLSHHIYALGKDHGWTIQRIEKVVGTSDGRVETISEYFIEDAVRELAAELGSHEWCSKVRSARAARRAKAAEAKRKAELANIAAAARRRQHPGQSDLFGEGLQ